MWYMLKRSIQTFVRTILLLFQVVFKIQLWTINSVKSCFDETCYLPADFKCIKYNVFIDRKSQPTSATGVKLQNLSSWKTCGYTSEIKLKIFSSTKAFTLL